MNPWAPLLGTLAYNFAGRHLRGLATICSTWRKYVPREVGAALLTTGFGVLLVHVWNGYPKKERR